MKKEVKKLEKIIKHAKKYRDDLNDLINIDFNNPNEKLINLSKKEGFDLKVQQTPLGKFINTGISKFLTTSPSPICNFCISETSEIPSNSFEVIFSFLKNCNSMFLIVVEYSFILQNPLKGLSTQQFIFSKKQSIKNWGIKL